MSRETGLSWDQLSSKFYAEKKKLRSTSTGEFSGPCSVTELSAISCFLCCLEMKKACQSKNQNGSISRPTLAPNKIVVISLFVYEMRPSIKDFLSGFNFTRSKVCVLVFVLMLFLKLRKGSFFFFFLNYLI